MKINAQVNNELYLEVLKSAHLPIPEEKKMPLADMCRLYENKRLKKGILSSEIAESIITYLNLLPQNELENLTNVIDQYFNRKKC